MSKYFKTLLLSILVALLTVPLVSTAQDDFSVLPYVQNPAPDAMTILWFSKDSSPGLLSYKIQDSTTDTTITSTPVRAEALAYTAWENETFFDGNAPPPPYRHRVRLMDLEPLTTYTYTVKQGTSLFSASFKTAPKSESPIRFIVYSDCETETESTGKHADWVDPISGNVRSYLLDQTVGYANNLKVIQTRQPDFVAIAGDLVESGGEQRDWDEFWRHLTHPDRLPGLASQVPLMAAPGNHEYYEGPQLGGYDQPGSERAINRFRTYFEFPKNNALDVEQEGRYYLLDYGPITLIALDVANGNPHRSERDTNFFLLGENDPQGGHTPDFNPGSLQYAWLETQLREAQTNSKFTFVIFHHVPYSVGPHGWPPGDSVGFDTQSGVPVRALTPLFMKYGVDAVLAGHDEIWERSEITGVESSPDSSKHAHTIYFYDVGIGGDGLRGPEEGLDNPFQKFLAHKNSPEVWQNGVLVAGGKHYGHLEVDVKRMSDGKWQAVLKPVYVFPLFNISDTTYVGYERRLYNDVVTLTSDLLTTVSDTNSNLPNEYRLNNAYPNPFNQTATISYELPETSKVTLKIYNLNGQEISTLVNEIQGAGFRSVVWDGSDNQGHKVSSGIYIYQLQTGNWKKSDKVALIR